MAASVVGSNMIELPRKPKKSASNPDMKVGLQIWVPETYWLRAIKRAKRKKQTAEEWMADQLQANEPCLGRGG